LFSLANFNEWRRAFDLHNLGALADAQFEVAGTIAPARTSAFCTTALKPWPLRNLY